MTPLAGVTVHVGSTSPAAAVCATQLERLGARLTRDPSEHHDVALLDAAPDSAGSAIACVFEQHRLDTGDLVASEATAQAALGYGDYVADTAGPRARLGSDIGTAVTGFCAAQAVLAQRFADTRGAIVRVSELRTLSMLKSLLWAARSRPDEWSGTHVRSRDRAVDSGYRTADGHVTIDFSPWGEEAWERFVARLAMPGGRWSSRCGRAGTRRSAGATTSTRPARCTSPAWRAAPPRRRSSWCARAAARRCRS